MTAVCESESFQCHVPVEYKSQIMRTGFCLMLYNTGSSTQGTRIQSLETLAFHFSPTASYHQKCVFFQVK